MKDTYNTAVGVDYVRGGAGMIRITVQEGNDVREVDIRAIDKYRGQAALLLMIARRVLESEAAPETPEEFEAWRENYTGIMSCDIPDIMAMEPADLLTFVDSLIRLIDDHGGTGPYIDYEDGDHDDCVQD